jgi:hypothetical protein
MVIWKGLVEFVFAPEEGRLLELFGHAQVAPGQPGLPVTFIVHGVLG